MPRQDFFRLLALVLLSLLDPPIAEAESSATVTVRADVAWTDTGVTLVTGQALRIEAAGQARVVGVRLRTWLSGEVIDRSVGPRGTYRWPRSYWKHRRGHSFPLPTMVDGPAPAFGLIGKINETGEPFDVGASYQGRSPASGRLWLGVNDDELEDNRGAFQVTIRVEPALPPAVAWPEAPSDRLSPPPAVGGLIGKPVPDARVLLIYVDGLRPDVLKAMAAAGFLPNFARAFLDQGVEVPDAFTVFPSNTLIANGSLFTGLFSDRTGIKSQNQFERTTLKPRGQLSAWLPDGFMPRPTTRVLNLLDKYAPEQTHTFLARRWVPTLGNRLGKRFRYTTLPIAPINPPPQWFHRAINTLGPFDFPRRLPVRLDEVNAAYAVEELIGLPDARVIAVWFPMADKTCHVSRRGQFGAARRDLALADEGLGRILRRLREVRWDRSTYLILVSDHGHLGGAPPPVAPPKAEDRPSGPTTGGGLNRTCNLPRDWGWAQLGCNVKVVGQEWLHPGMDPRRFLFFDHQGAGQAKLFLPYGSYQRGAWQRNRLHELTHYDVHPAQRDVNLLESLTGFRPTGWDGRGARSLDVARDRAERAARAEGRPVDLLLVKLDAGRTFVYRDPDNQAILHRTPGAEGTDVYRYEPVRRLTQSADGALHVEPARAGVDPFGYLSDPAFLKAVGGAAWIGAPHSAQEWLTATAQTRYPDAVVAIAKFFAWQAPVADLADARDPDLVVTASAGWSFRSDDGEGTDHGYPLPESMRMALFLAGPNIPHGRLLTPHRIVDVLPTILQMIGWPYDPASLDGRAITGIYE